jgi:hypothetical protein
MNLSGFHGLNQLIPNYLRTEFLIQIMAGIFGTSFDDVLEMVRNWRPEKEYGKETDYRDDLVRYLRKKLNEGQSMFGLGPAEKHVIQIESGRGLADIGIDKKIGIELKLNLDKKKERNRLFGQVKDYMEGYQYIIIVLCGQTNESEYEQLHDDFKGYSDMNILEPQRPVVKIVRKDKKMIEKEKQPQNQFGFNTPQINLPKF